MKALFLILLVISMISCSPSSTEKKAGAAQVSVNTIDKVTPPPADIPAGAKREKFADNPALEKITVTSGTTVILQGNLLDGKKEGSWTENYPNGMVRSMTPFVQGFKEGTGIELNENGQLIKRTSWHHNLLHGEYREYNYNNLRMEGFYQFGKLEGTVKKYYDNTRLMEESLYKNGIPDGISRWYDQNGKLTIEYVYQNGVLVKQ